ncbi:MAG: acetyltransferase [Phycisphaeraceae bacterium]|nr:acetyltransferase [Phycisphaeraceae bacterium]
MGEPLPVVGEVLRILGAGGHGKVVAECAHASGWREIHFFDDGRARGDVIAGWTVHGTLAEAFAKDAQAAAIVALGDNAQRLEWLDRLAQAGVALPTIVAPSAVVSPRASLGAGSVVVATAVIAVDARIGRGAIINTTASIDHDCVLGDGVHISPGARLGGGVSVGDRSWIGIGASVRHGIRIGADVMVGAGAAVVNDLPDGARVGGVPARPLGS